MVHRQGHSPEGHHLPLLDHIQVSGETETIAEAEGEGEEGSGAEEMGSGAEVVEEEAEEECPQGQGEMTFTMEVGLHLQDPEDHPWGVGRQDIECFYNKEEKVRK